MLIAQALEAAPIVALTGNWIFAYNVVLLLSFVIGGFGAYLLTRQFLPIGPSIIAGCVYTFSFYRIGQYSTIQIMSGQWIPLALLALLWLWRRPGWGLALFLAATVSLQVLSSFYLGLFLLPVLAFWLLAIAALDGQPRSLAFVRRFVTCLAGAAVLTLLIVLPFALPYFRVHQEFQLARTLDDAIGGSATIRNYLTVPPTSVLYGQGFLPFLQRWATADTLFPGFLALALGLVGLAAGRPRRWSLVFLGLTALGVVLSFGPRLHTLSGRVTAFPLPYAVLYSYVPGFQSIRDVGRFGIIATLGFGGLAAGGAAVLTRGFGRRWGTILVVILALGVSFETLAIPTRMTPVETPDQVPPVYHWLAQQPDNAPALELPTIEARWLDRPQELERQGHEQYLQIYHWHPTPSGYSGFDPSPFWTVIREARQFPDPESTDYFRALGLKYVIFHASQYPPDRWQQITTSLDAARDILQPVAQFADDRVYVLAPAAPTSEAPAPRIVLPSTILAGESYRGFLEWANDRPAVRLAQPTTIHLQVSWQGPTNQTTIAAVAVPLGLIQGETTAPFDVPAPTRTGTYDVTVTTPTGSGQGSVTVVAAAPRPLADQTSPALHLVDAQIITPVVVSGGALFVQAQWRLRHSTEDEYLLRTELVDDNGHVVASGTVNPFDGQLSTRRWLAQETIDFGQSAIVPPDVASGSYQVRLLVKFADGADWKLADPAGNDASDVPIGEVQVQHP